MQKRITTITILTLSIILVAIYIFRTTYSLIINVIDNEGKTEIINKITIRDLITDENGAYNSYYYDALNELNITRNEANILIESTQLNNALDIVINSVVDYRLHGVNKLTDNEIYNLIVSAVNEDNTINDDLRHKVISKADEYISDISDYLYGIKTSKEVENA